jgi:hypothetical protein
MGGHVASRKYAPEPACMLQRQLKKDLSPLNLGDQPWWTWSMNNPE